MYYVNNHNSFITDRFKSSLQLSQACLNIIFINLLISNYFRTLQHVSSIANVLFLKCNYFLILILLGTTALVLFHVDYDLGKSYAHTYIFNCLRQWLLY